MESPTYFGTRAIMGGAVAGLVVAIGSAVADLVATSLNTGLVLGMDGVTQSVRNSTTAVIPGVFVAATAALLYAARKIWWAPALGRIAAGSVVTAIIVLGSLQFDDQYSRKIGFVPWWEIVTIASSQSMLPYAFVGMVGVSLVGTVVAAIARKREPEPAQ